ncbi:glycosyltransferase family 2 protein [Sporomusa paucivorans]|uniref:glycosyltransferase family 2 protein n=1 Tax=Sporomusa paucivorans TaxID=2376 RepID=UPI003570CF62
MNNQVFSLKPNLLLSVVICTYNRAKLLQLCLKSLVAQTLSHQLYEVIIIDNNSTDDTKLVSQSFCAQYPNVRMVTEFHQGLSHARNRGWLEAKGEYIAYIDDDAKAFPDWCEQIVSFTQRQPSIKVFGGPYYPFTLKLPPDWFPPEYGKFEICYEEREIDVKYEWICGSNMTYHRSIFNNGISFDVNLGMKGSALAYGEETHLMLVLANSGHTIYYVPSIKVYHLIASYKMALCWLLKSEYNCGKCSNKIFSLEHSVWDYLLILLRSFVSSFRLYIRYRREPFRRRVYYSFRNFFYTVGGIADKLFSK